MSDFMPSHHFSATQKRTAQRLLDQCPIDMFYEKRGSTRLANGMVSTLNTMQTVVSVRVADALHSHGTMMLISDRMLPAEEKCIVTLKSPQGDTVRYLGTTQASRPGMRDDDDPQTRYTPFVVETIT